VIPGGDRFRRVPIDHVKTIEAVYHRR